MKLGLSVGYSGPTMELPVERVQLAERLGYDSVWTAEAYGSDAVTPLAYLAAVTSRIKLGTAIMQVSARTPANAAMSADTIDAMAGGGRFIAGLGVSGPQIVEGWYGQPWGRPYYWLKDYVAIMRQVFRREAPVTHDGKQLKLPYTGEGALGVGKPLQSILHMNPDIPIYIGSGNEATVRLTGEIADGWIPLGYAPGTFHEYKGWLEQGFERAVRQGLCRLVFLMLLEGIQPLRLKHPFGLVAEQHRIAVKSNTYLMGVCFGGVRRMRIDLCSRYTSVQCSPHIA